MRALSTAICEISYDEPHRKLFVRFSDGDEYLYVGVPPPVHRAFVKASAKGAVFSRRIRDQDPYNTLAG